MTETLIVLPPRASFLEALLLMALHLRQLVSGQQALLRLERDEVARSLDLMHAESSEVLFRFRRILDSLDAGSLHEGAAGQALLESSGCLDLQQVPSSRPGLLGPSRQVRRHREFLESRCQRLLELARQTASRFPGHPLADEVASCSALCDAQLKGLKQLA